MKQLLQNLKTGDIEIAELPYPQVPAGHVLIRSRYSLISSGTERMMLEFGKANWVAKAKQQPDKVRMVLDKVKTDGLGPTIEAVKSKLEQPMAMGYCNVGEVMEVSAGVTELRPGDRVASNGHHAEYIVVPKNLCAKIPADVADEDAAFTVLGSIALQSVRLAEPSFGEYFAVFGLGLVGLLTAQLLKANGCHVIGLDFDPHKLDLAAKAGIKTINLNEQTDPVFMARSFANQQGIDGVIIAAATDSHELIHQAATMSRKRGRIILVGVTGLNLSRADFYEKELRFQVSCSYGPGRYDDQYELQGQDYPLGFVRWTEQRNFQAILQAIGQQQLHVKDLISHRFAFAEAQQAYDILNNKQPSLGILLQYPHAESSPQRTVTLPQQAQPAATGTASAAKLAIIGAGNYASRILIPAFKKTGAEIISIASQRGLSGYHAAKKNAVAQTTTDAAGLLGNEHANTIVIATRHHNHAQWVCKSLAAGKHVFVEKPLAITQEQLDEIKAAIGKHESAPLLMVGFNRRFAPHIVKIKSLLNTEQRPKHFMMTVNAGHIDAEHWTQDSQTGGGRIIGEVCHFVDLLHYLAGSAIVKWQAQNITQGISQDSVSILLSFADGSVGTIHYLTNGHPRVAKERLEVFCGNKVLQLNNFRQLQAHGWGKFKKMHLWQQDKGQNACAAAFIKAIETGQASPIPLEELFTVAEICIEINKAITQ